MTLTNLSRRNLLKGAAGSGAFVLGLSLSGGKRFSDAFADAATAKTLEPNVWVSINEAGDVTIVCHRSEMGQGIRTGLPAVLADELEADWSRVTVEQALGDKKYGDQNTDGSRSIRWSYEPFRKAGAAARTMLERAAAEVWQVDVSKVYARNHEVRLRGSGKRLGYGELTSLAAGQDVPADDTLVLKDPKDFKYIGKPVTGVDMNAILTGTAQFAGDVRLPGMRFAVIARPPVVGGKVKGFDDTAAKKVPGVEAVIELPALAGPVGFQPLGGIAVVAANTWAALQGREALDIEWENGANASYNSADYRAGLESRSKEEGRPVRIAGEYAKAAHEAEKTVSADYYSPHLSHAPMEPPTAIANVTDELCEIWACSQDPQAAAGVVAQALKIAPEKIRSHTTLLGGAFGRKSKPDFIVEAVILSKTVGKPVQVLWTREDDIRHDYFHTVGASHFEAAIGKNGKVSGWLHRCAMPTILSTFMPDPKFMAGFEVGQGMTDLPYEIENVQCENAEAPAHVRIGWFRSVYNVPMAFAIGSFADEVAHARGMDPVDNLVDLLGTDRVHTENFSEPVKITNYDESMEDYPLDIARYKHVVEKAAKMAGWGKRKLPKGHALGIAAHRSFVTYVATVVEVKVDEDGGISVPRAFMAVDCGHVVNPDRVKAQMEGAAVFGLSLALYGEITATDGAIDQSNFHDYAMTRISMAPEVEVHLVENDAKPGGVGEPGVPPFAPALCNAIFAATGKRIRQLPIGEFIEV